MSKEAIDKVLEAEETARTIRERAEVTAREQVAACERDARAAAAKEREALVADLKARHKAVSTRADALIAQSREEAGSDIEALRAAAEQKMREAVKHIEWELCDI